MEVTPSALPTLTAVPTLPPTATATLVQDLPTPVLPPGNTNKIALVSGNDLYLMNPDGSELTLVRTENSPKSNLHWIAGGRLIYMSRNCAFMLDAQTNRVQQLTCFTPSESLEGFRVSPDGKYVAISVQRTLNILPFDTDVLKDVNTRFNLITLKQNCFYNQYPFRDVRWSKDNTQLAAQVIDTQLVNSDQVFLVKVDIPDLCHQRPGADGSDSRMRILNMIGRAPGGSPVMTGMGITAFC